MKTLVFSDSHLTSPFEEKKYNILRFLIKNVDNIIINGDFWEGYQIQFEQFIQSPWHLLFPILKSKKTIYLFGNHDKTILSDERVKFFSNVQTHQYKLKLGKKTLLFEHGNRILPFFDDQLNMKRPPFIFNKTISRLSALIFKKYKKKYIDFLHRPYNAKIKERLKNILKKDEIFICGHTHAAEFNLKERFINTGFIRNGLAQYLLIYKNSIVPKEEWYD